MDCDPFFVKEYEKALAKKKDVNKETMAVALEFNQIVASVDIKVVLNTAYETATAYILEYLEGKNIADVSAFYKRAESYDKIINWYKAKKMK